jgi:ribosome maturation protein Sdo1
MDQQSSAHQLRQYTCKGKKQFKKKLKSAPKEIVRLICELCLNLIKKRIHPNSLVIKALSGYKHCIRYLAAKGKWEKKLVYILKHITFVYNLLTPALIDTLSDGKEIVLD